MVVCSATGCNAQGAHKFPKNPEMRKKWELAVNRENFKSTPYSRLCPAHFLPEDFAESPYSGFQLERKILKRSAVPSVFKQEDDSSNNRKRRKTSYDQPVKCTGPITELEVCPDMANVEIMAEEGNASDIELVDENPPIANPIFAIDKFKTNDNAVKYYTGLDTYQKFECIFQSLLPEANMLNNSDFGGNLHLPPEGQFLLTLVKLKRNKESCELAILFDVSKHTVSHIFCFWINLMYQKWSDLWPNKDHLSVYMPEVFKNLYPTSQSLFDDKVKLICVSKPVQPTAVSCGYKPRTTVYRPRHSTPLAVQNSLQMNGNLQSFKKVTSKEDKQKESKVTTPASSDSKNSNTTLKGDDNVPSHQSVKQTITKEPKDILTNSTDSNNSNTNLQSGDDPHNTKSVIQIINKEEKEEPKGKLTRSETKNFNNNLEGDDNINNPENKKQEVIKKEEEQDITDNLPTTSDTIKSNTNLKVGENVYDMKHDIKIEQEEDPLQIDEKDNPVSETSLQATEAPKKSLQHKVDVKRLVTINNSYKILHSPLKRCYLSIASKIYACCHMLSDFKDDVVKLNSSQTTQ